MIIQPLEFTKLPGIKGKYLVCNLNIVVHVLDKGDRKHRVEYMEQFIVDSGSPATFLRQSEFERVAPLPLEDLCLEKETIGPEDDQEEVYRLFDFYVPDLNVFLPKVFLSRRKRPFSLLGTDFLEHFQFVFNPRERAALLWRLEKNSVMMSQKISLPKGLKEGSNG